MGVDQRGRADDLARHTEVAPEESVARIMNAVRATDPLGPHHSDALGFPAENGEARPIDDGSTTIAVGDNNTLLLLDQLEFHTHRAELGEAASARRVAELLELMNRKEDAIDWWHRAARLGDSAAAAYVKYILA
ncbi:hypothetical protein [Amycolatopsis sp. TNS106]|uniref:hypothetical protein n=1 Tax=Amycolatopsis sp. TNS106 TaxID=2861750 RepID=UPI001C57BC62|nr:hypothetical protein [Amycolatopsis sp. TNS106]QXV63551.1 hypothetical protein CVV72_41045 [Amycolatopsis sp. TNS106]